MGAFPSGGDIVPFYAKFLELAKDRGIMLEKWLPKPRFPDGTRILKITEVSYKGIFVKVVG